jgi:hypothetical protein
MMNMQFFLDKLASCFSVVEPDSDHPKEYDSYVQNCSMFLNPVNACDYNHNGNKSKPQHRRSHTVDNIRDMRRKQSRALGMEFKSSEWDDVLRKNSPVETSPRERTAGRQSVSPPKPVKTTRSATTPLPSGSSAKDIESHVSKSLQEKVSRSSRHNTPQRSLSTKSLRSLQSKDDIFRLKGKHRQLLQEMSSVSTSVTEKIRLCLAPPVPLEDKNMVSFSASTPVINLQDSGVPSIQQEYARTIDTGDSGPASMYFERTMSQLQASQPLFKSYQVPVSLDEQDGLADMLSIRAKNKNISMVMAPVNENSSIPLCFDAADGRDYVAIRKKTHGLDTCTHRKTVSRGSSSFRSETSRDVPEATRTESSMSSVSQHSSRGQRSSRYNKVANV